jgi:hypothetical protein
MRVRSRSKDSVVKSLPLFCVFNASKICTRHVSQGVACGQLVAVARRPG